MVCVLVAVFAGGAFVTWTAARWLIERVDVLTPDTAVIEALTRLDARAQAIATSLGATGASATDEQIAAAAGQSAVAVATIGRSAHQLSVWAVAVERQVPSDGRVEDVWACFSVAVAETQASQALAEVHHPERGCAEPGAPQALAYATARLNLYDAVSRYGEGATGLAVHPANAVVGGMRILATDVQDSMDSLVAADEPATIVLGPPDAYLYALRLTVGPGDLRRIAPVRFPANLDLATRAQAESDAKLLIDTVPGLSSDHQPPPPRPVFNRGALISLIAYEETENQLVEHTVVRVVEGGGFGAMPRKPSVLVCYAITHSAGAGSDAATTVNPEPCGYPLIVF